MVEPGDGYDLATAHSILHNLPAERCVELQRSARAALRPGGLMAFAQHRTPAARPAGYAHRDARRSALLHARPHAYLDGRRAHQFLRRGRLRRYRGAAPAGAPRQCRHARAQGRLSRPRPCLRARQRRPKHADRGASEARESRDTTLVSSQLPDIEATASERAVLLVWTRVSAELARQSEWTRSKRVGHRRARARIVAWSGSPSYATGRSASRMSSATTPAAVFPRASDRRSSRLACSPSTPTRTISFASGSPSWSAT
jgi:hypothetical protein